jgi:hypothetical protein
VIIPNQYSIPDSGAPPTAKIHYANYKLRIANFFNVNIFADYNTSVGHNNNMQMVLYNRSAWQIGKWRRSAGRWRTQMIINHWPIKKKNGKPYSM